MIFCAAFSKSGLGPMCCFVLPCCGSPVLIRILRSFRGFSGFPNAFKAIPCRQATEAAVSALALEVPLKLSV